TAESPDRRSEDVSKLAAKDSDEAKAAAKERQIQRPLGHWEREVGPYHITLRVESDRLFGTFVSMEKDQKVTWVGEADYSVTKDSVLYGVITGVELPGNPDGEVEANQFVDLPFSAHFRMDDSILTIKNLKFLELGVNGKNGEAGAIIQGRYKKKSSV